MKTRTPNPILLALLAARASARRGWRVALTSTTALGLLAPAGAVFTSLSTAVLPNSISIRVGSQSAVDTVNFGTVPGNQVGNGTAVSASGTVEVAVRAFTAADCERTVTVNADSSLGMICQTPSRCATAIIPFSSVRWTVSNASAPSGATPNFNIQPGSFNGSASQTIASFPSDRRLSSSLSFKYANNTVYPAGSYQGRVTYTASMP